MTVSIKTRSGDEYLLENAHNPLSCNGRYCIIHRPIKPTEERSLIWRDDKGMFEECCDCGIGHPAEEETDWRPESELFHGCCGIERHCRPHKPYMSILERYDNAETGKALVFSFYGVWKGMRQGITDYNDPEFLGRKFSTWKEAVDYATGNNS